MELRHLVYFVTVAEERNFSRAAARLRVVQSGVSAAIRVPGAGAGRPAVRAQLAAGGADRRRDGAAAGRPGHHRRRAGRPRRRRRGPRRAARDAADRHADLGRVRGPAGLLGQFQARHPGVDLRLRAAPTGSAGLARSLLEGELDVAFLSLAGRPPAGLAVRILAAEPIVAVLPAGHHLAGRRAVGLADLADEPFVDSPPGYGNRTEVDRGFAAAGLHRRVALEVADIATVAQYVRNGLGIALIPRFSVPAPGDGLLALPLSGVRLRWTFGVATGSARPPSAAVQALLDMVDAHRVEV